MSLNSIRLKPRLLVDLYHDALVQNGTTSVPEIRTKNFLGNNTRKILILVTHTSVPYLPDDELNFLGSILSACKLSLADVGIVNLAQTDEKSVQEMIEEDALIVLIFGTGPASIGLPIHFPAFQVQQFNKRTYLHAPALSEVENDKALKLRLWNSLKNLFGL